MNVIKRMQSVLNNSGTTGATDVLDPPTLNDESQVKQAKQIVYDLEQVKFVDPGEVPQEETVNTIVYNYASLELQNIKKQEEQEKYEVFMSDMKVRNSSNSIPKVLQSKRKYRSPGKFL